MSKVYTQLFSPQSLRRASLTVTALLVFAIASQAATFTVNQIGDAGDGTCDASCTLRDAVNNANALADADQIVFASPLFGTAQTIDLTTAELEINQSVTITVTGARLLTVRRSTAGGTPEFRIFQISGASSVVNISGITITGGNSSGSGSGISNSGATLTLNGIALSGNTSTGSGGGIYTAGGVVTILNSTVSGNAALDSGGIYIGSGTVNIANSTVSGNIANGNGGGSGGIFNSGTLNLNNVTVTNNSTTVSGGNYVGGVKNNSTVNTRNTIISGNLPTINTSPDVRGFYVSNGNNLIGNTTGSTGFTQPTDKTNVAANLGSLANNGGQTDTHELLTSSLTDALSPAINAGNNCVVMAACGTNNPPVPLAFDQRGTDFLRQIGTAVDIGAFELQVIPTAASVSITGRVITTRESGLRNALVTLTDVKGNSRTVLTGKSGIFRFTNVAAGETYIISVASKRYRFAPQVIMVNEDVTDLMFTAQ